MVACDIAAQPERHLLLLHPFNGLFPDNLGKPAPER